MSYVSETEPHPVRVRSLSRNPLLMDVETQEEPHPYGMRLRLFQALAIE